ncbi:MAG: hypothetical protein OIF48_00550 [Silicimonas sp.]|nr:hypothetical protein [Silicimonas sp.]
MLLILGLLAGLTLPGLAAEIRIWLPQLVALLLCVSAMRIGLRAALGSLVDLRASLTALLILQLILPLGALGAILALGLGTHPLALALILMLSAPSIAGSPSFAAMMGHDPAPPMRLLIFGTAVFPLTAMATLWILPGLGGAGAVLGIAARFALVIAVSVGAGFALRRAFFRDPASDTIKALDGASAILLSVMVVGLMAALGPALRTAPADVGFWMVAVLVANFGLQALAYRAGADPGTAIVAGNRNIALYLVALPAAITDPLLIFIGCYQIPMYLTPIVMARLYRR